MDCVKIVRLVRFGQFFVR